jgi:hypothetical protein
MTSEQLRLEVEVAGGEEGANTLGKLAEANKEVGESASKAADGTEELGDAQGDLAEAHADAAEAAEETKGKTEELTEAQEAANEAAEAGETAEGRLARARNVLKKVTASTAGVLAVLGLALKSGREQMAAMTLSTNTFGVQGGKRIEAFGNTAAMSLGLSKTAAVQSATTFGTLLTSFDVGKRKSSVMARELVSLSVDLAKFKGASQEDVQNAIWAGMAGKGAQLKKYGISLDQQAIKAEALRRGLVKTEMQLTATGKTAAGKAKMSNDAYAKSLMEPQNRQKALHDGLIKTTTGALTPHAKAMATYGLIMQKTTSAQGAFARSHGKAGTEMTKVKAQIANLRAELGTKLVPVYNKALGLFARSLAVLLNVGHDVKVVAAAVKTAVQFMKEWSPVIAEVTVILLLLNARLIATTIQWRAMLIMEAVTKAYRGAAAAMVAVNLALRANPIGIIITLIGALVVAVTILWKRNQKFREIVTGVWNAVKGAIGSAVNYVKARWRDFMNAANSVGNAGKRAAKWVTDAWNNVIKFFRSMPGKISSSVSGMWQGLKDAFKNALNWIITKWNNFSIGFGPVKIPGLPDIPKMSIGTPNIPLLAAGGTVRGMGSWITGDAGPEENRINRDGSVTVRPLTAADRSSGGSRGGAPWMPVVQVLVGGKNLAREQFWANKLDAAY